jgi:hypothetical protein
VLTRINPLPLPASGRERRIGPEIMKRSLKNPVAWIAIVGVLFAQMAMAAYAFDGASVRVAPVEAASGSLVGGGGAHCAGIAPEPAPANMCEVHCTDGAALPSAPDLPPVLLTALPVHLVPFAASVADGEHACSRVAALPGAPPPTLRYCRLRI